MENGVEISNAKREVFKVPNKKGNAPNLLVTGSHSPVVKNLKPNALMEGIDDTTNVRKTAIIITTMVIADNFKPLVKSNSESLSLLICFAEVKFWNVVIFVLSLIVICNGFFKVEKLVVLLHTTNYFLRIY